LTPGQHNQLRDALILEAHVREKRDIFVTTDTRAFVKHGRRARLEALCSTRIMTVDEFCDYVASLDTPRLDAERAPRTALAGEAVTHRDPCQARAESLLAFGEFYVGDRRKTLRALQYCGEHAAVVRKLYLVAVTSPIGTTQPIT
jgi:hypothetical protein